MKSKYRYLVPNGITFASLTCGIVSIFLAATEQYSTAGALILSSYVLDLFDGAAARHLNAGTEFGLQLDSLVDMVSLGTAPAMLAFMYLYNNDIAAWYISGPLCVLFALAGAFRLARFNLLPPKASGSKDSDGLTISTGGATLALAVMSELTMIRWQLPAIWLLPLIAIVALLMVSYIPFPSFTGVFKSRTRVGTLLVLFSISLFLSPLSKAWFFWNNIYLGWSVVRAGYSQTEEH